MLNSAVSDFSAKMSKHFHSNSVMPLSEANLSRHTLQSPASREAKLRHILVYVDLQRELIALAEEEEHNSARLHPHHQQHRTIREKKSANLSVNTNDLAHSNRGEEGGFTTVVDSRSSRGLWHNNNNTHPKRSDLTILLHNSTIHEQPYLSSTPQQTHERQLQGQQQQQQNKHHQPTVSPSPTPLRHHDSSVESLRQQRQHHQQQERNTRQTDALDPSLALPRALPRNRIPGYRDSYLSADLDAEWQLIDDVGPDSPTIPNNHYPAFEFAPGHNESRHALSIQSSSKSAERPIQYRRREESAEEVAVQRQPLQRQASIEKEKKTGRFGRFSLPGKSKRASTTHQRKESLPEMSKSGGGLGSAGEEGVQARSSSISNKEKDKENKDRVRFQEGTVAAVDGVELTLNPSASMVKRRSKVRQLLSEIFKKVPKQQQQSQVISAPSTVRRAYPGSGHNVLVSASITPQDLPPRAGTSLSHYARESLVDPSLQRELYQIQTPPPTQEHLVLADNSNDINNNSDNDNDNSRNKNNNGDDDDDADTPFLGQTSLTPPPAASVLRYSTSRPINLDQILSFHQGTAAAEDTSNEHRTRPSSNLMPIAGAIKDLATAAAAAGSGSATGSGTGSSDPYTSQRRLVALTPEQPADLEGVGCRQNTFGMDCANDLVVPSIATA
ncbi:hypothetical protein EC957_009235 [Mortierella hygrophila]|uniref:Uncharacterized protein n=1 Tax=Mortierella hygrophila TaxID=979708 RepID=A0A9P6FHD9_9FUNG|nr:hypothetical protein EC957_009235 [Mortierella hygrophila]